MKASLKFREDQKPLLRAKVPLSIVGFPFQSGIVAGESKELSLNLTTFFDSGPSFKFSYRPNDSLNPFTLIFKTGIGHFGSPISSPITMSAEFNLVSTQNNPTFFVHFNPQFGDFAIKKSHSSDFVNTTVKSKSNSKSKSSGVLSDDDASIEVIDSPNGLFSGDKIASKSPAASLIGGLLNGTEMSARTIVPVRQRAVVKLRWGVRFPTAEEEESAAAVVVGRANPPRTAAAGISFQKFPLLVMNKIAIEHVAVGPPSLKSPANDSSVKRQLEVIEAENGMLKKAMDDLRSEIVAGKLTFLPAGGKYNKEAERRGVKAAGGKVDRKSSSNGDKKSSGMEEEEELNNKALIGDSATGSSI